MLKFKLKFRLRKRNSRTAMFAFDAANFLQNFVKQLISNVLVLIGNVEMLNPIV